jgi:hypothetical protein
MADRLEGMEQHNKSLMEQLTTKQTEVDGMASRISVISSDAEQATRIFQQEINQLRMTESKAPFKESV